jgi:hypothetical protein
MGFIAGVVRYEMNEAHGKSGLAELFESKHTRNQENALSVIENARQG